MSAYYYRRYRRRSGAPPLAIGAGIAVAAVMLAGTHGHHGHGNTPSEEAMATQPSASSTVALGQRMAAARGWTGPQWTCLDELWTRESGWRMVWNLQGSGAYGIPQALPASKMASAGADYMTDPATQIRWGLGDIRDVYGTPCSAWAHEESDGWY